MDATSKPLADQAFDGLLTALRGGQLASSGFFSMPELSRQLGYPIAAIREATKLAAARGLLTILPKRGITVMDSGSETARTCMDMRAALEREGARRMIVGGKDFPVESLRETHRDLLEKARAGAPSATGRRAIEIDLSLHNALSDGLDNRYLRQAYAENRDRIAVIQQSRPFLQDRIMSAMEEHLQIIAAMEARDLPGVVKAIDVHLAQTLRWWGV
ncbi:GntR family transcriptional regulator [Sedimentitalea sp. JM2-8]|uniref:GntR family transcriptional regulator n=1 Tax=Sedimentitalea xiamensis TaxID=3050037 RepID=A0ABT7FJY0_9RHOB|nr:GntR family transcriptional regulator [Sedimentitalea xiamensis]MDK3075442.1 GntR family transcriptional regulator [Sedimentitalea xiamensis]